MRMEEEHRSHMTERILNLTLEIIYLLTGESFPPRKSGDHVTITVPPVDSLKPDRPDMEKIVEATKKMMELLTGEVPIRRQDVTVYLSMEEWEYLEGHKDLYKDVMMEDEPDGSRKRNPPQRCPRPLEDLPIPRQDQSGVLGDYNIIVKEEDEECGIMEKLSEGHKDMTTESPPERCSCALYIPDPTPEDLPIPRTDQGEDFIKIKVVDVDEAGMRTVKAEDTPIEIGTGLVMEEPSKDRLALSPGCKMEDEDVTADCAGKASLSTTNPSTEGSGIQGEKRFPCPDCGERFKSELGLTEHQRSHTVEKLHSCTKCGESYLHKRHLIEHQKSHYGEALHSCPQCGKCFLYKSKLVLHERSHTGEKPFSCLECGKSFVCKSNFTLHQRSHTGENLYSCSECGKSFVKKSDLTKHQLSHTGDRLYSCSACGKCFLRKSHLTEHHKSHTGEKRFSCSVCGKSFIRKSHLSVHERLHTGEKPYICFECGKRFVCKTHLNVHLKSHTGEKPYSCPDCGKRFSSKSYIAVHQRSHTGEKPYSCSECGKCFVQKLQLTRHKKFHMAEKTE